MRKKPVLAILTLFMTVFLGGAMYACGGDTPTQDNGNQTPPEYTEDTENRSYWIKVNQESVELLAGESFSLSAELYLGTAVVDGATFTWESADTSVATVSQAGFVTAIANGETEITVKASEYENVECTVAVVVNPLLTLDLSVQEVELSKMAFEGYQTTAEIEYEVKWNNEFVSNAAITISSSNENVLTSVSDGKILLTANEIGDSVVTAKFVKDGKEVETYIYVSVVKPYLQSNETYLFSAGKKNTIDLSLIEATKTFAAETVQKVSTDSKEFPITSKEGTVVTISETSSLGYDGSLETPVTIELEDVRVGVTLKGYTHVIRTVEDFDNMKDFLEDTTRAAHANSGLTYCKKITGYYVLANDIDFATAYPDGYASPFSYTEVGYQSGGYSHGWMATFDGNGHTISNLKLVQQSQGVWCNSLFGIIASGGKVQNVAFKNCSLANNLYNSAFLANFAFGSIENVYLDVTLTTNHTSTSGNAAFMGMAANQGVQSTDSATKISNVTVVVRNVLSANDYVMKGTEAGLVSITGSFVVIGGGSESKYHPSYATGAALQAANANVKAYTGLTSVAADTALTACGSTTFAKNGSNYTIKWNGKTMYEEPIEIELEQQLYSISDATIDLSKVSGDIQSIKDVSGNEITYTLNNATATVSGDDVLNGTATSATGAIETLKITTSAAVYLLPLKVCTDVIYNATDFDNMKSFFLDTTMAADKDYTGLTYCQKVTGYYVLANDIDFATAYPNGYASPFSYKNVGNKNSGYSHGWMATFDGKGHTISNLNLTACLDNWCNSLFGIIASGGKVQNVAFKNCSLANNLYNSAFLASYVYGSIENVYLEVTLATTTNNVSGNAAFVGMANNQGVQSTDKATTISNVTVIVNGLGTYDYAMKGTTAGLASITGTLVIIGVENAKAHSQYTTITDLTTANGNISVYTSAATASSATTAETPTLTACGSATFATVDGKFVIKWNGKEIYNKNLATNS